MARKACRDSFPAAVRIAGNEPKAVPYTCHAGMLQYAAPVIVDGQHLATIIMGASVATLFPVTLSFASEVIPVTGKFTSLVFVGASTGGMLVPWLIGQFFESAGPHSAMWIMLVDMVFAVGIFTVLYLKKRTA